ncbi:carbonic anhydrase 2-like [Euwallacea fornicatus]|uniref:carbonic anhydrase 2-like n=1 Tax=Euwallacea fornicatus TaxID=995702 RepID=UPI00338FFC60
MSLINVKSESAVVFAVCCIWGILCQDFGYDGDNGPSNWGNTFSQCLGKHQSPIDIETHNVVNKHFHQLRFENFDQQIGIGLFENNGHTVMMKILSDKLPLIYGGPLQGSYKFEQLHFHWGPNDTIGSENQINHHSFPLEMHIVMYNTKYGYSKASVTPGGLTVLSYLTSVSAQDNKHYDKLEEGLHQVQNIFSNSTIYNVGTLNDLIAKNRHRYYTYEGSLTTPPCSEAVTWIEFEDTIPLSAEQISAFRLLSTKTGRLTHNYRPTQPLNGRIIFYNNTSGFKGNVLSVSIALFVIFIYYSVF